MAYRDIRAAVPMPKSSPVNSTVEKLQSIVDDANKDTDTYSYLLLEVPFKTEDDGVSILELANALQKRIFINAEGVEMRSTLISSTANYDATLVIKSDGSAMLHTLYGNDYPGSDERDTEMQCASLFETEFGLIAKRIYEHVHATNMRSASTEPAYTTPTGIVTIYFSESKRGYETKLK